MYRIMSMVNIGLHCVGLMRATMSDEFETSIVNCNNLQQLCQAYMSNNPIPLLNEIVQPLELKGQIFEVYSLLLT